MMAAQLLILCVLITMCLTFVSASRAPKNESFLSKLTMKTSTGSEDDDEITISDVITVDGENKPSGKTNIPSKFAPCKCTDPAWCDLPMPPSRPSPYTPSHYNMPPVNNQKRWEHAKCLAARGDQVLLRRIMHYFSSDNNFLNGDGEYRHLQPHVDVFLNPEDSFKALIAPENVDKHVALGGTLIEPDQRAALEKCIPPKEEVYQRLTRRRREGDTGVIPGLGGIRPGAPKSSIHYPIVSLGYPLLSRGRAPAGEEGPWFGGAASRKLGGYYLSKMKFLKMWSKNRHLIDTPFVAMYVNNENWGFLGTILPNRTTNWEFCDEPIEWELKAHMHAFLDDPNTIALVVNQHHNFTHPKVITVPLGLPSGGDVNKTMFAAMHAVSGVAPGGGAADADPEAGVRRQDLMFVASSNWGPRPIITECVRSKLKDGDFVSNVLSLDERRKQGKQSRGSYYESIGRSRMGLSMPGLGYDTYRTWELLTLGSVVVTERGAGFDRTFSRLPVLLLDDFSHINSELMRSAYVEAIYHVNRFQFEKLTQSFWFYALRTLARLGNHHRGATTSAPLDEVSTHSIKELRKNLNPIFTTYFPMSALAQFFTRPLEYSAGQEGQLPEEFRLRKECELYPKIKKKHQRVTVCNRFPKLLCPYGFTKDYHKNSA